jgi:hypothetical protein
MKPIIFLALALLIAACGAARPDPSLHAIREEQAGVARLVHTARQGMRSSTAASGYKNTEPIIGILTQPCTECPGR